jgi:hypothetical protein
VKNCAILLIPITDGVFDEILVFRSNPSCCGSASLSPACRPVPVRIGGITMKSFITRDCIFNLQVIIIRNRPAFREEYGRIRETSAKLHGVNTSATLNLHPAVFDCLLAHQPDSWHSVILEQPHLSVDGVRVAYTRSEEHMEASRQTVTTVGKYIKRHWSYLRDDVIRDLVALHCVQPGTIKVLSESTDQFIEYLKRSPDSCMNKEHFRRTPITATPQIWAGVSWSGLTLRASCRGVVWLTTPRLSGHIAGIDHGVQTWKSRRGCRHTVLRGRGAGRVRG